MTDNFPKDEFADLFEDTGIAFSSYLEAGEPTATVDVPPDELREALEAAGFSLVGGGDTAGRWDTGESLNLLAVNIQTWLVGAQYQPEIFAGLLYPLEDHGTTVVIFDDGQFVTVDAPDEQAAHDALSTIHSRLVELDQLETAPENADVEIPAATVPVRV